MLTYTALDNPVEEPIPSSYEKKDSNPYVNPRKKWELHFNLYGQ